MEKPLARSGARPKTGTRHIKNKEDGMSHSNTERMGEELQEIMKHSKALLEATGGELDEQVKKARKALEESLANAKEKYGEYGQKFMEQAKNAAADTDRFVKEKPYYVIGGTFVVGLLLGWVLSRK